MRTTWDWWGTNWRTPDRGRAGSADTLEAGSLELDQEEAIPTVRSNPDGAAGTSSARQEPREAQRIERSIGATLLAPPSRENATRLPGSSQVSNRIPCRNLHDGAVRAATATEPTTARDTKRWRTLIGRSFPLRTVVRTAGNVDQGRVRVNKKSRLSAPKHTDPG